MLFKSKKVAAPKNINQKDAYCSMIFNYYKDLMIEVKKNLGGIS